MNNEIWYKLIKFLLVGGICTIINYGTFYSLLNYFKIQYLFSSAFGYVLGLLIGYYINKFWTYKIQKNSKEIFMIKYLIVYIVSLTASTLLLKVLVEIVFLSPLIANVFTIGLSTIMNFIGTNFIVFKNHSKIGVVSENN